ncbi:MAG: hypothetical protein ACOH1J_07695 [Microbacteriaceae bacterium]
MSKKQPEGLEIFGAAARPYRAAKTTVSSTSTRVGGAGAQAARRRRPWLGVGACVMVVAFAVVDGFAIAAAIDDNYELAVILAVIAAVGTVITFLVGAVALVVGRGRWWGLAAMALSVLTNPVTLVQVLVFFSDFSAT